MNTIDSNSRPAAGDTRPGPWEGTRTLIVDRKVPENGIITSFYLVPEDGEPLPAYEPGQFLPIELDIPGHDRPVNRTYTLSDSPNHPDCYRLTIKREPAPADNPDAPAGLASNFMHDQVEVGAKIRARAPAGDFFMKADADTPVVLLSGGVGLTPMISMLNTIAEQGGGRTAWYIHGARGRREHCMGEHVRALADAHDNINVHVVYETAGADDVRGRHHDSEGYITGELLNELLGGTDYEFYLCGPPPFMKAVYNALCDWGVDEGRIHYEFFGPATVLREGAPPPDESAETAADKADGAADDTAAAAGMVTFSHSGQSVAWDPTFKNILEFAEAQGLMPDSSCRSGICQTCMVDLVEGEVAYDEDPIVPPPEGSILICQAKPVGDVVIDL